MLPRSIHPHYLVSARLNVGGFSAHIFTAVESTLYGEVSPRFTTCFGRASADATVYIAVPSITSVRAGDRRLQMLFTAPMLHGEEMSIFGGIDEPLDLVCSNCHVGPTLGERRGDTFRLFPGAAEPSCRKSQAGFRLGLRFDIS